LIGTVLCATALLESEGKAADELNNVQITWPVELRRLTTRTCKAAGVVCAAGVAIGADAVGDAAVASSITMQTKVPAIVAIYRSRCASTRHAIFRRTFHTRLRPCGFRRFGLSRGGEDLFGAL
jgi:hypothetical protein